MKKSPDPLLLATSICKKLFEKGYTAYFAGGFVRDLLLGYSSSEIDIATNASPDQVAALFTKTIAVGKQFGVMVVVEEGLQFEVTTFRKDHPYHDGRHPEGVDFSTPEKDALRRDFTINGMFYDPLTKEILDYVGGQEDLKKKQIKAIGEPHLRFQEDRLRLIRAVRFAARLSFSIEEQTYKAIQEAASTLFPSVSMERIWQEFEKMAAYPHFDQALLMLQTLGLLPTIFPQLHNIDITPFVASFAYFPLHAPTVTYLLQLFPKASLQEKLELCSYLKLSNKTVALVTFFHEADGLEDASELYLWARFYAHPQAELYLAVKKATLPPQEHRIFSETHEQRQYKLRIHIDRMQKRKPLITSDDLKKSGILPGKRMGELLEKAIRLSVNEDIHDKREIVSKLLN
jgi:poly(A) polymerase